MTSGTVSIRLIAPHPGVPDHSLLTDDERARAAKFRFVADARFWIHCRSALRLILGSALGIPPREVPVIVAEFGKPLLAEPFHHLHFNLSHADGLALVALSTDGPVGIDIEPASRAGHLPECREIFCHPAEIAELASLPSPLPSGRLLEIWSAKEALLKAIGTGFSHPPETVRIHAGPPDTSVLTATSDTPLPGIEVQRLHRLHHPDLHGYIAILAAASSVRRIEITRFPASTTSP